MLMVPQGLECVPDPADPNLRNNRDLLPGNANPYDRACVGGENAEETG
jgi:hypothetical protein